MMARFPEGKTVSNREIYSKSFIKTLLVIQWLNGVFVTAGKNPTFQILKEWGYGGTLSLRLMPRSPSPACACSNLSYGIYVDFVGFFIFLNLTDQIDVW